MTDSLQKVRAALLEGLRAELASGREAFERHQLLAIRFHRAARLNTPGAGDKKGWQTYFGEHLPSRRTDAVLLFEKWRTPLLKDEMPGRGSRSLTATRDALADDPVRSLHQPRVDVG